MNEHKSYVLQVLKKKRNGNYSLYRRWGKIGELGSAMIRDFEKSETAINEFKNIIKAKLNKGYRKAILELFDPSAIVFVDENNEPKDDNDIKCIICFDDKADDF